MSKVVPNVIGIGFPRAGTTFISAVLSKHPEVCFSSTKETHFFSSNYGIGWDQYEGYFRHFDPDKHKVIAEWSNDYIRSNEALHRIKENTGSDVKLLACYRDPIDAFLSTIRYRMMIGSLDRKYTPRDVFEDMTVKYVHRLFYDIYLENLFEVFPGDRVLVMRYEDLECRTAEFFRALYDFVGVSYVDVYSSTKRVNVSQPYRSRMVRSILHRVLSARYGADRARVMLRYCTKDLPVWLSILQRLNTKNLKLDTNLEVELREVFAPHMKNLQRILSVKE